MLKHSHFLLLISGLTLLAASCQNFGAKDGPVRPDAISIYTESPDKTLSGIQVPLEGVEDGTIHIVTTDANVETPVYVADPSLQSSDYDWLTIKSIEPWKNGEILMHYSAKSLLSDEKITKRGGQIYVTNPATALGRYINISQGYTLIYENFFDETKEGYLVIPEGGSYETEICAQLANTYYDYVSFNAWIETDKLDQSTTYAVTLSSESALFDPIRQHRYSVSASTASDASGSFRYVLIGNGGVKLGGETTIVFSNESNPAGARLCIDNLRYYKISEGEIEDLFEEEEIDFEENENW